MIAEALFGRAKLAALNSLFVPPYGAMHLRELARAGSISPSAMQRELQALCDAQLLLEERRGNQRLFKANARSPAFDGLRALVQAMTSATPHAPSKDVSKARPSTRLKLSAPYDWPNSGIGGDALIAQVLRHQRFEDVVRICAHFGVAAVERTLREQVHEPAALKILTRMIRNIKSELKHAPQKRTFANTVSA